MMMVPSGVRPCIPGATCHYNILRLYAVEPCTGAKNNDLHNPVVLVGQRSFLNESIKIAMAAQHLFSNQEQCKGLIDAAAE